MVLLHGENAVDSPKEKTGTVPLLRRTGQHHPEIIKIYTKQGTLLVSHLLEFINPKVRRVKSLTIKVSNSENIIIKLR